MEVGHWLNTVGAQSRGKEENLEYGAKRRTWNTGQGNFYLLLAKLYGLSMRDT